MRASEIAEWRDVLRFMSNYFMDAWLADVWANSPLELLSGKTPKAAWEDVLCGRRVLREYLASLEEHRGWFTRKDLTR
jgi:hypothetical protein